jgi:hypothetical protein
VVRGSTLTLRAIAVIAAGSAAIHQARYAIGYGASAGTELASHGHGYLAVAVPVVVAALVFSMAALLMRLARGRRAADAHGPFAALWIGAAGSLALIFTIQESIEGAGPVAHGGWIGLALAVPAGLLVALALRGASAVEAAPGPGPHIGFAVLMDALPAVPPRLRAGRVTAFVCSARAPPSASVV